MAATDQATYSFVDDLAASVPELKTLLATATSQKWDAQRFADAVQTTKWWKTNSDTAKQMVQLQATDPAEYNQQITNAQQHVIQIAQRMGVTLTTDQVKAQATADLYQGLDDNSLQYNIGNLYSTNNSQVGGTSVTLNSQIQQLAASYGVPVTQSWIDSQVKVALAAGNGTEGAQQALVAMAKSTYPSLAQQLDSGMTTEQIAQPYIASMAQTLEIPDSQITLNDPTIKKALTTPAPAPAGSGSSTAANAQPTMTTLYDFQNQLRTDPRWDQTSNAKQSAYSMLASLGKTFGVST